jgi:hypothetical protein
MLSRKYSRKISTNKELKESLLEEDEEEEMNEEQY